MSRCTLLTINLIVSIILISNISETMTAQTTYIPTWDSLDARPIPEWYDDAKFGIFLHWGVYSVPSVVSEWFWKYWKDGNPTVVEFMKKNYPPGFSYQDFASHFTAEFFNADEWAEILYQSGAKYVVLTSKHHEGFTMWPSSRAYSWNSVDVGPHRDLVGELSTAVRKKQDMHFGVYYSLYEWYNPIYILDKKSNFKNQTFVHEKFLPEVTELIEKYQPDVLWTDGDWESTDEYWTSKEFLAWLYSASPVKDKIVVNDRWGSGLYCHHGGVYTCTDRYNPGVLQPHKWENCMTVDSKSWGYRRNAPLADILEIENLIKELVTTVSCGGNLLMNVGPTKEGTIVPIFQDRLKQMGQWLRENGRAIYNTTNWIHQNDTSNPNVWYTKSKRTDGNGTLDVYAITLTWPKDSLLYLGSLVGRLKKGKSEIYLMGSDKDIPVQWTQRAKDVQVQFPPMSDVKSKWSWSLRMTNVKSCNNKLKKYS